MSPIDDRGYGVPERFPSDAPLEKRLEGENAKMSKYHQSDAARISPPFLRLSVSGREYDIPESVARSHVGSVFALLATYGYGTSEFGELERKRLLNMRRIVNIQQRWFVERTPAMFEIILQYLYTRHLHCPVSVCQKALQDELKFWRLENVPMAECCFGEDYQDGLSDDLDSQNFGTEGDGDGSKEDEAEKGSAGDLTEKEEMKLRQASLSAGRLSLGDSLKLGLSARRRRWLKCKRFLWRLCHGPSVWMPARIFNGLCVLFILVSIVNLILSTLPELQCNDAPAASAPNLTVISNSSSVSGNFTSNHTTEQSITTTASFAQQESGSNDDKFDVDCPLGLAFDIIEAICIAWFTLELILRFISYPDRRAFLKSPMNIIDILATAPYYVEVVLRLFGANTSSVSTLMVVLRILRMLRIFRVLRLARYFQSLKLFGNTVAKSRQELGVLVLFLLLSMIIFSSMMYYLEKDVDQTAYTSIPASFYWAVVTLTTTGYGDVTPKTTIGKIFAGLACVAGILVLAFPVSILVEHFNEAYKAKRNRRRRYFDQDKANARSTVDFQYAESSTLSDSHGHSQPASSFGSSPLTRSTSATSKAAAAIGTLPDANDHPKRKGSKASVASMGVRSAARVLHKRQSKQSYEDHNGILALTVISTNASARSSMNQT